MVFALRIAAQNSGKFPEQALHSTKKELLDRIGAEKRSLIVSKALDDALLILSERHSFEEWQETVSTFIINLAAAPAAESERFASMSRPEIVIKEKWSRQLEALSKNILSPKYL